MGTQTKGLAFPIILSNGTPVLSSGVDLIKSSLKIILTWPLFTRFYEDTFGSRIHEALEDPNDDILITLIQKFTFDSISKWEPRITLISTKVDRRDFDKLFIELVYRVNDINIQDSFYFNLYTTT